MITDMAVQEAMDQFVTSRSDKPSMPFSAERCMEMFAEYLLHYSDLYQDGEMVDEDELQEWEAALGEYVENLFESDGESEQAAELGSLPVSMLEPEHFRDFIGWALLREAGITSLEVEGYADVLINWIAYLHKRHWLSSERNITFLEAVQEIKDESMRASQAARLLFHYVRLGGGVSPRNRGKRFEQFIEGHARIYGLEKKSISLRFDNKNLEIGPVALPEEIARHLKCGDVLDIELGSRGGTWLIVDIGPVYPSEVYVDADEFEIPEKLS
ncbi:hypothetical protein ACFL48_01780 [Pseudomonadota bacterium]